MICFMIYLGWLLILLGLLAIFSGIVGFLRFPDFFTKMHAASVIECCGIPLCLVGLACLQHNLNSFKLLFIVILILLLNPVATHALGRVKLLIGKR